MEFGSTRITFQNKNQGIVKTNILIFLEKLIGTFELATLCFQRNNHLATANAVFFFNIHNAIIRY